MGSREGNRERLEKGKKEAKSCNSASTEDMKMVIIVREHSAQEGKNLKEEGKAQ